MRSMNSNTHGSNKPLGIMFKAAVASIALATSVSAFAEEMPDSAPYEGEVTFSAKARSDFLEANRIVRLTGSIDKDNSIKVIDQLRLLSEMDPVADITLIIHSNGGSVASGLAIYDAMQSIPNDIRTVCEGPVMSMGATLLSAGAQGKRDAYPNCEIMYHQTSGDASGKTADREIKIAESARLYGQILDIISQHTGWSKDDLEALMDHNLYLSPEEAKELGFIDNIIEPVKALPTITPRTDLPDGFCDKEERRYIKLCP